jgi:RNA polymerase sigma-70 factor (ECF subfamily)
MTGSIGRAESIRPARTEETAVIRTQEHAASELFEALYPRLAGWCRRLVDDDGTAHEIASEAFTRLWARWTKVEEPTGFLYVTAANLVRDHWRKMERERRAMRRVRTEVAVKQQPESADPSVRMLVQSLPDRLRDPALLYYYADLPVREVAALLGRNEGTVKADLHAARELLRAKLGGHHDRIS